MGDTIRVLAEDSVGVSRLILSVYDRTASQVIESGEKVFTAQIAVTVEWEYTATVAVAAYDLSGNQIETTQTKQLRASWPLTPPRTAEQNLARATPPPPSAIGEHWGAQEGRNWHLAGTQESAVLRGRTRGWAKNRSCT